MKKYRSKKAFEEAKRRRRRLFWIAITLLILVIASITIVTRLEAFRINKVVVQGAETVDQNQIEKAINLQLDDAQLLLVSNQTPLTFPKSKTEESILKANPALDTVDITISNNTVMVTVSEKLPYAIVCDKQKFILEECQVITIEDGLFSKYTEELQLEGKIPIIVRLALEQSEESMNRSADDIKNSSADAETETKADTEIDNTTFSFVKDIITFYDKENINPFEYVMVSSNGTVDVYYKSDVYVRFIATRELFTQIEALETSFAKMNEIAHMLQEYEYVDVRFEDRVYFKKKDEIVTHEETQETQETEESQEAQESQEAEESTVQNEE